MTNQLAFYFTLPWLLGVSPLEHRPCPRIRDLSYLSFG